MLPRRPLVLFLPAVVATPAMPMGVAALTILTSIISAAAGFFSAKAAAQVTAEGQLEALQMQWKLQQELQAVGYAKPSYSMADKTVRQETAYGRDGAPLSVGWTDDLDSAGTYAGLAGGRIGLERGKYSGVISTAEAMRFSDGVRHGEPMAVPVEPAYHTYSPGEADRLTAVLGRNFSNGDSLVGGRRYSRATRPTTSGWDLESVMVANQKGDVRALAVHRNALQA